MVSRFLGMGSCVTGPALEVEPDISRVRAYTVRPGVDPCMGARATLSPMEYAKFETAALAHVDDSYYFGAYCGKCKHTARISLVKLRERLGDCFPLVDVRLRLRCQRCRSKHIIVTFLTPDHCTADFARLFELPVS
jgi:hypothetical protein